MVVPSRHASPATGPTTQRPGLTSLVWLQMPLAHLFGSGRLRLRSGQSPIQDNHYTTIGRFARSFEAGDWHGRIVQREPTKCAGWDFVDLADPPDPIVPYLLEALRQIDGNHRHSERGWS
jgi:hypothetical protein